ncbi:hypothetical protein ACHAWF_017254 [Thalassiosira exigua]
MTMAATSAPAPQDPSSSEGAPPPSGWREAASELSSLLSSSPSSDGGGGGAEVARRIDGLCAAVLASPSPSSAGGGAAEAIDDAVPDAIRSLVATVRLRALIQSGNYSEALDRCRRTGRTAEGEAKGAHAVEEAYALYRLRRYAACLELCESIPAEERGRGLRHVRAQALHRLGETRKADEAYRELLADGGGGDEGDDPAVDDDEREDALANALAVRTGNYTPGSLLRSSFEGNSEPSGSGGGAEGVGSRSWMEEDPALAALLSSPLPRGDDDDVGSDDEPLQNYDLAYNLATWILVSSDARDQGQLSKAKALLERAEASALALLESPSNEDEDDAAREKRAAKAKAAAEREAGPIRANLALAKMMLGGEEGETEALRTYLTLVTNAAKKGGKSGGNKGGTEANLLAAASNNLALLRDGKESVFDSIKRIPAASSLSVSEDDAVGAGSGKGGGTKGGGGIKGGGHKDKPGGSGGIATVPLAGATPHQARIALFNRALLYARMGHGAGCAEALGALRASLEASRRGDDDAGGGAAGEGGGRSAPQPPASSPARKAKKKAKKRGGAGAPSSAPPSAAPTSALVEAAEVPAARPSSAVEAAAWSARADWVEGELRRASAGDGGSFDDGAFDDALAKLDEVAGGGEGEAGAADHARSHLLLHRAAAACASLGPKAAAPHLICALESLPPSVREAPGTAATLASLCASSEKEGSTSERAGELMASLGGGARARLAGAEFLMERGKWEEAATSLRDVVEGCDEGDPSRLEAIALLVKALSRVDPSGAEEYLGILQEAMEEGDGGVGGGPDVDGEKLESMEIPRFAKRAQGGAAGSGGGAGGSSSRVRKMIAATGGKGRSGAGDRKKKNRDAILRKRAKQREAYLSRLASEGRCDPAKAPKPDPERWIPKSQRSYNRRGRGRGGGRYRSDVGAQGGGAGAGMERDAARLDVAARGAGAGDGGTGSGKPSTAHVKVSSSGAGRKGKGGRRR